MKNKKPVWREYAEAIVIALALAFVIRLFVIQAFKIPSGSMIPTLLVGDHLLVNKFIYRFREPKAGEVVVFKFPQDHKTDFIKRIVALPGQEVEMRDKKIYIDDVLMEEPFAFYEGSSGNHHYGPIIVPEGKIFVMGDNRDNSYDSRFWGSVELEDVVGKAIIIYWSWDDQGFPYVRWGRIGDLIR